MSDMRLCGVAKTETGDIVDIYFTSYDNGSNELFYNNDPYGIVSIYGLKDVEIREIQQNKFDIVSDGYTEAETTPEYQYAYSVVASKARGEVEALIYLSDRLLIVRDLETFEGVIQSIRLGEIADVPYTGYVDVTNVDEDSKEYSDLIDLLILA